VQTKLRILVAVVLAFALTSVFGSPASAATIACNKNGGAPSVGVGGGNVTAYYSHRCNVNPGANEVEYMLEELSLWYRPVGGSTWTEVAFSPREWVQAGVDFSFPYAVRTQHGYYRAQMDLILQNWDSQNFSYGSVPGCGRADVNTVACTWTGGQKYA
jgi:hypothetical protein